MARVTSPVFVGRVEELRLLDRALAKVAAGEAARVVLLGGEAGVGKTRLVREFAAKARDQARVLSGASFGAEMASIPYAPVVDALRRLMGGTESARRPALFGWTRHELAVLLPELADPRSGVRADHPGEVGRGRLFAAFLGVLERLAAERPTVLVLEDLHLAERSTLDLVAYITHALDQERLLLLVTFRSDEVGGRHPLRSLLARLARMDRVDRVELGPLTPRDIGLLMEAIQGRLPDAEMLDRVVSRSQGNAFFAEELIAAAADGITLPRALRELLELRLESLPRRARRLLDVASVAGRDVDVALLRQISGFSKPAVEAALHDALDQGLLVRSEPEERGVEFRHALMAETVRSRLLSDEQQDLHRAIASSLERRAISGAAGAELAGAIAHHLDEADEHHRALPWLLKAGAAAEASYAWAEAEAHYSRAIALWDASTDATASVDRAAICGRAAEAAFLSGQNDRAVALARMAISLLDPATQALRTGRQYARLAQFLMWTRAPGEAADAADRAVRLTPVTPPSRERAEALSWRAAIHQASLRYGPAVADATAALAIARDAGDVASTAPALCALGILKFRQGAIDEGRADLEGSRLVALEHGRLHDAARADYCLAAGLADASRFEDSLSYSERGVDLSRTSGLDRSIGDAIEYWRAYALMRLGRTDEAADVMRDALAGTRDVVARRECRVMYGWILLRAGQLDEADRVLDQPWPIAEHQPADTGRFLLARVEADLVRGRCTQAVAIAKRAQTELDPRLHAASAALAVAGILAANSSGDAGQAAAFGARLRSVAARCQRQPLGCRSQTSLWLRAGTAELERPSGRRPSSSRWMAIAQGMRELSEPFWCSYALYRAAERQIGSVRGRPAGVVAAIDEARSLAVSIGAAPLIADIDTLARRLRMHVDGAIPIESGGVGRRHGMARAMPRDPFALTRRESEVLTCLAEGLSDGAIAAQLRMAKATASVHVMNIKQKLGADSRVEVVTRAIAQGLVPLPKGDADPLAEPRRLKDPRMSPRAP